MHALLVYGLALLGASLLSAYAQRSVLSTAVIFLAAGLITGTSGLDVLGFMPSSSAVGFLSGLALVSVLFTDGMKVGWRDLVSAWRLPGRALLLGFPLTLAGIAVLARLLLHVRWPEAWLVGAVLTPTDPVFASAIVGREEIPVRLRNLLNVESGLNDGLALPIVLVLLAASSHAQPVDAWELAREVLFGVGIGTAIPAAALAVQRLPAFGADALYAPFTGLAIGLLVFGTAAVTGENRFLAMFAAGVTIASISPDVRQAFGAFGEKLAELFKLAALLAFGGIVSLALVPALTGGDFLFVGLVLGGVRLLSLELALAGSRLDWRERLVAGWFGPKGFASVVYGLMVLQSSIPDAWRLFHVIALVTATSIVLHSSTDVPIARWFEARQPEPERG